MLKAPRLRARDLTHQWVRKGEVIDEAEHSKNRNKYKVRSLS